MLAEFRLALGIYGQNERWNARLIKLLDEARISGQAKRLVYDTNADMAIGMWGYVAQQMLAGLNGDKLHDSNYGMWQDACLHIFGTKMVDDYFDKNGHNVATFLDRVERVDWGSIKQGKRHDRYNSAEEEAAVFFLEKMVEKFGNTGCYIKLMDELLDSVIRCEVAVSFDERKHAGLEVGELTLKPMTQFLFNYGSAPSNSMIYAMNHFGRGAMIWDHLADLYKDMEAGAFNFVLEDAFMRNREAPVDCTKATLGRYMQEASDEFEEGGTQLSGSALDLYKTFVAIVQARYWVKHKKALRKFASSDRKAVASPLGS